MKKLSALLIVFIMCGCGVHKRSNVKGNERFVAKLSDSNVPDRGLTEEAIKLGFKVVYDQAKKYADKQARSMVSKYSYTYSVKDYYTVGKQRKVRKTYDQIEIAKFSSPSDSSDFNQMKELIVQDLKNLPVKELQMYASHQGIKPKSRGEKIDNTEVVEFINESKSELMDFDALIKIESDEENPGITRLSLEQFRVLFTKNKVFKKGALNAKVDISMTGKWRGDNDAPVSEQLLNFSVELKNLKYGLENQVIKPIKTHWFTDLPPFPEFESGITSFGLVNTTVTVTFYEAKKSKYVNKLPELIEKNKDAVVVDGPEQVKKLILKK